MDGSCVSYIYFSAYLFFFLLQSRFSSLILEFVWNKKTPRLRCQVLYRCKALGGMALLNMLFYYWATNIRNLNYWLLYEDIEAPLSWLVLEANSTHPVILKALLHAPIVSSTTIYTKNVIVASCLKIWVQFRRHFGLQTHSMRAPLEVNHVFPPFLLDNTFFLFGPGWV